MVDCAVNLGKNLFLFIS